MRLSELSLKGKAAIVTGGGQGIGRAISLAFGQAGACVAVADLDPASADEVAGRITSAGGRAIAVAADVTDEGHVQRMVAKTVEAFGHVDILVNNAGGASGPGFSIGRVTRISERDWDETFRVNVKSTFLCSRAVAPLMLERKAGSIINMASITGQLPWAGLPAYSAAKAAVISLTQSLALELAPHVRVNALAPGLVETARTSKNRRPEQLGSLLSNVLLGRMGRPEEIADIALYLASDVAAWMTGNIVNCNGGQIWMAEDGRPNFRDGERPSAG